MDGDLAKPPFIKGAFWLKREPYQYVVQTVVSIGNLKVPAESLHDCEYDVFVVDRDDRVVYIYQKIPGSDIEVEQSVVGLPVCDVIAAIS